MDKTPNKHLALCLYLALAAATVAAYWPLHQNKFISFDDPDYITENANVRSGLTINNITWAFTTGHANNWHPLTWLSHMLDCQLFGLNPTCHHLTNLILHLINTLLLFAVLKKMTRALWPSFLVAALFALHPLHVESVAWASERKDVLSALFWFLATAAYLHYAKRPGLSRYLLLLVIFALGLMAKPMLVTLPFVLLLLDYWPLQRFNWPSRNLDTEALENQPLKPDRQNPSLARIIAEKIPLLILAAVSSVITFIVQQKGGVMKTWQSFPLHMRFLNALISYVRYIGKIFYPKPLAILYPYPYHGFPLWQPIASAVCLLTVSALVIYLTRTRRYPLVGWFWFLGTLIPVIGLVQVGSQAIADRYTYLPSIGIFVILAWAAADLLKNRRLHTLLASIPAVLIIAALLILTRAQLSYWKTDNTLFEHTLKVTRNNSIIHNLYGKTLLQQHRLDDAVQQFTQAVKIVPNYYGAYTNLGYAFSLQGRLDDAIAQYNQALRLKPDYIIAHNNLGLALQAKGQIEQAIAHYNKALQINPNYAKAYANLGSALLAKGKINRAVEKYKTALKLEPFNANIHFNLGLAMARLQNYDQSLKYFQDGIKLNPNAPNAHYMTARILIYTNRTEQAVTHLKQTIRLKPDWPDPINTLARLLLNSKDSKTFNPTAALQYAKAAAKLTNYQNPAVLDTLAAAYAANADFKNAITTAQNAFNLAQSTGKKQLADQINTRLKLYKSQPTQQQK